MSSETDQSREEVEGGETTLERGRGRATRTLIYALGGGFAIFIAGLFAYKTITPDPKETSAVAPSSCPQRLIVSPRAGSVPARSSQHSPLDPQSQP